VAEPAGLPCSGLVRLPAVPPREALRRRACDRHVKSISIRGILGKYARTRFPHAKRRSKLGHLQSPHCWSPTKSAARRWGHCSSILTQSLRVHPPEARAVDPHDHCWCVLLTHTHQITQAREGGPPELAPTLHQLASGWVVADGEHIYPKYRDLHRGIHARMPLQNGADTRE
jgi:hypothetical protein